MNSGTTSQPQGKPAGISRRALLASAPVALGSLIAAEANLTVALGAPVQDRPAAPSFRYCLNTSTINGPKVPLRQQLQIAASNGYDSVELWLRDIEKFLAAGGTKRDLSKEIQDLGLEVDSAIAFGQWIVDDEQKRKAGLERSKRDMQTIRDIGGTRIAAPPSGATKEAGLNLDAAAERYHALLEVGREVGVTPQVELWGHSKNLSKLQELLYVAAAADHADACLLLDVYHLYKGGSNFSNIGLVPGRKMHCLHMNDYPSEPDRTNIGDADRVYPGDGVAPMTHILRSLAAGGFDGALSLELFNPSYWQEPPELVAKTGIEKMKQCVAKAFA